MCCICQGILHDPVRKGVAPEKSPMGMSMIRTISGKTRISRTLRSLLVFHSTCQFTCAHISMWAATPNLKDFSSVRPDLNYMNEPALRAWVRMMMTAHVLSLNAQITLAPYCPRQEYTHTYNAFFYMIGGRNMGHLNSKDQKKNLTEEQMCQVKSGGAPLRGRVPP